MSKVLQASKAICQPGSLLSFQVESDTPLRIDSYLASKIDASRTFIQELVNAKAITINEKIVAKASTPVCNGHIITARIPLLYTPEQRKENSTTKAIEVIAEYPDFVIINKPAGLICHPPHRMSQEISLVDWVIAKEYHKTFIGLDIRPGIVHRLDKDTSGIMIIAKNRLAHEIISDMFKNRIIQKTYYALVSSAFQTDCTVDSFLTKDPINHHKMTSIPFSYHTNQKIPASYKRAITRFTIAGLAKDNNHSLLMVVPLTGRTHQIRVHASSMGYPIIGDMTYATSSLFIKRQALHAYSLSFSYKGESFYFVAKLPIDMTEALQALGIDSNTIE